MEGKRLSEIIEKYNQYICDYRKEGFGEFFDTFELEFAKAFMLDFPVSSVTVSKIILAMHDVGEIKIKIE